MYGGVLRLRVGERSRTTTSFHTQHSALSTQHSALSTQHFQLALLIAWLLS